MDFDRRFKLLLTLFFREFLALFFPEFFENVDWRTPVEFLDKELASLLPERAGQCVDLLVKLRSRVAPRTQARHWMCLIHVEAEARRSRQVMGKRMCRYFHRIDEKFDMPIIPVALYVRVGGGGLGWQIYDMPCWGHCINHFEFPYIRLRSPVINQTCLGYGTQYSEGQLWSPGPAHFRLPSRPQDPILCRVSLETTGSDNPRLTPEGVPHAPIASVPGDRDGVCARERGGG